VNFWQIGAVDELLALIRLYPEKNRMCGYSLFVTSYTVLKQKITALFSAAH